MNDNELTLVKDLVEKLLATEDDAQAAENDDGVQFTPMAEPTGHLKDTFYPEITCEKEVEKVEGTEDGQIKKVSCCPSECDCIPAVVVGALALIMIGLAGYAINKAFENTAVNSLLFVFGMFSVLLLFVAAAIFFFLKYYQKQKEQEHSIKEKNMEFRNRMVHETFDLRNMQYVLYKKQKELEMELYRRQVLSRIDERQMANEARKKETRQKLEMVDKIVNRTIMKELD